MEYVFKTQNITKIYKNKKVLKDVNIGVKKGEIYGLIGKNGAGKTTLMKILTGIIYPTSGKITINESEDLSLERKKIGSLIEQPSFYQSFSATKNLKLFATLFSVSYDEIPKVLELVGLSDTGKKRVGKFSLGMKQRLGIAIAMLGNPEILVLDEPINGLDPEGIKDIRDLLIKINKERGTTILISSHLLDELSKIATTYCIIDNGTIIEELSKEEFEKKSGLYLKIVCNNLFDAQELLIKNYADIVVKIEGNELHIFNHTDLSTQISKLLVTNGFEVSEFSLAKSGLEDYFIEKLSSAE